MSRYKVEVWFGTPRGSEPGTPATGWKVQTVRTSRREADRDAEDYRASGNRVRVVVK